jgi:hypothetical protein
VAVVAGMALALTSSTAQAQLEGVATIVRRDNGGTGGVRVGEGVYLRLGILAEAGYDTNVFYNDAIKKDAPTLQVTPRAELTNTVRDGQNPVVNFSLSASLLYREYLSDDTTVRTQRAFNPTFSGHLGYAPSQAFSITAVDTFARLEDPPYVPGGPTIQRDLNTGIIDTRITPGGGRLQNTLRYTNTVDRFESESASFANRMAHEFMLGASYKWLPKTAVFVEGSIGYVQMLDKESARAENKYNSMPYRAIAGLRGLVTPKTSINIGAGYQDSIYEDNVVNPSGLSNFYGVASLNFQPGPLTSFVLGYEHGFRDSPIIGNYFDVDAAAAALNQQVGAFVLRGFYLYEFRRYQGIQQMAQVSRRDHLQRAGAQADYFLQRWFFAGIGFTALVNRSNFGDAGVAETPADYTKFQVLGRLGITY